MPMSVRIGLLLTLIAFCTVHSGARLHAQDTAEADQIAQTASRAEAAGEYELAAGQWETVINDYPDSPQLGVACYHSGFCHIQLKKYEKAIERLEQSIRKLDPNKKVAIAQAWLFLGFAEMKLGRQLAAEDPQASSQLLTTATQTFLTLLEKYPDFEDADQALFFQGEAFEALNRLDKAAESYDRMLQLPDPEFKLDGLFALAFIRGRQGKYDDASRLYAAFEADGEQHPSYNEVRLRSAEVLMELARAAENLGESDRMRDLLQTAASKFAAVADSKDPDWMDQARFRQADCLQRLGQYASAAELYESVAELPDSKLANQARVYAGRDYLRGGNGDAALRTLEKAVAVPSPFASEAAHWLAQFYLRSKQHEQAYQLAAEWIGKTENPQVKAQLMLDQADAAYAIAERKAESPALYLKITDEFPEGRLAASAMYHAAFAAMELQRFDDAIELSGRFRDRFAASDYLPDVMEVEGDSLLLNNDPESSEKTFVELVQKFDGHPKSPVWKLRAGLARYMQKKYEDCIQWLTPLVGNLARAEDKAEALHWIGSSYYQLGRANEAIDQLNESLASSDNWRRADETLLTLSRALYADRKPEEAKKTTQQLVARFPDSPLVAEAGYRLAEFEYDAGNYPEAEKQYRAVVENFSDSQFAPYALYGIGWAQLQQNQFQQSAQSFDKLIESFPDSGLATQALIGRASSYRQSGQPQDAIQDLEKYLQSNPVEEKKIEALYEMGLAQIAQQQWPEAIATFTDLIDLAPDSSLADRFHYELAWARRSHGEQDGGVTYFRKIADDWPTSPLAAEANFHVAQDAYQQEDYTAAAEAFKKCLAGTRNQQIREKAIYKLAWTYYKQKDYEAALKTFREQIQQFPEGNQLYPDGLFMVSETLYESNQFDEAFQEYRVAKPVIETSKTVSRNYKILTLLHGAQAANKSKRYPQAIEFARPLIEDESVEKYIKQEAQMEIGDACRGLQQYEKAIEAYEQAARHPGRTGARSMTMIGEILFDQKQLADAINRFKLVFYGYGGTEASEEVKHWQALAVYEAARCHLVQISSTQQPQLKQKLIDESKKHLQYLVEQFPDHELVTEAQRQLTKLEAMQ